MLMLVMLLMMLRLVYGGGRERVVGRRGGVGGGREEQRHRPTINLLFVIDIYTSIWPFFPTAHILSWALEVFSFPSRSSLDVFIDVY